MEYEILNDTLNKIASPNCVEKWSLIVAVISCIVSGIAIFTAINVPKKIAEQQNKIALFEKRFEQYRYIRKIVTLLESTDGVIKRPEAMQFHFIVFCSVYLKSYDNSLHKRVGNVMDEIKNITSKKQYNQQIKIEKNEKIEEYHNIRFECLDILNDINVEIKKVEFLFNLEEKQKQLINEYIKFNMKLIEQLRLNPLETQKGVIEKGVFKFANEHNVCEFKKLLEYIESETELYKNNSK